jgi:hypothetical protein
VAAPALKAKATDLAWPMYFITKPLVGKRVTYKAGDMAEIQTKDYVRALGPAFGVKDADRMPFAKLPYVKVLNVCSAERLGQIKQQGLNYEQARKIVGGTDGE